MALKDWKKSRKAEKGLIVFQKNRKDTIEDGIIIGKNGKGIYFITLLKEAKTYHNRTKSQALKFAEEYMKKH